jgi:hypothetical protein
MNNQCHVGKNSEQNLWIVPTQHTVFALHKSLTHLEVDLMPSGATSLNLQQQRLELCGTGNTGVLNFEPVAHNIRAPRWAQALQTLDGDALVVF